jgi:hypothetical protein
VVSTQSTTRYVKLIFFFFFFLLSSFVDAIQFFERFNIHQLVAR